MDGLGLAAGPQDEGDDNSEGRVDRSRPPERHSGNTARSLRRTPAALLPGREGAPADRRTHRQLVQVGFFKPRFRCFFLTTVPSRGELKAVLFNSATTDLTLERGGRVVQLLIVRNVANEYEETEEELTPTERGAKGFGSSGL